MEKVFDTATSSVNEAEGYSELGMFENAWNALENLTAAIRAWAEALRIRLNCCTGLKKWELGNDLSPILGSPENALEYRQAAGMFYLACCRDLIVPGDKGAAKAIASLLINCWPEGRLTFLHDSGLAKLCA